jgi:hypothetical protein
LRHADHGLKRLTPLGEGGAEVLATISSRITIAARTNTDAACSNISHCARPSLSRAQRSTRSYSTPIRLHENAYTVLDAWIEASSPPHFEKQLERHAHDRKGIGYRATGRQ